MVARPDLQTGDQPVTTAPPDLPVVVIVGRPNVGKSTLFNAITRTRRSIVGDEPGITRDRIHGEAWHDGRHFLLIDTGGIIQNDAELIPSEILKQARVALSRAAQIIFLIDGRTEITGADRDLAKMLRQIGKPVTLAVNKIDSAARENLTHEFHALGFSDLFPVSAEHRLGISELLDHVTRDFEISVEAEPTPEDRQPIKIAIIGRPNVGKSTLLNRLVGEERSIVSPIAGTTRDAVDESIWHNGVEFVFVDTAGIRRKGKTKLMAEKLSVVMARRHIRMANVVVLVMDASEGMIGLDATIGGYAHESGRSVIIVINKWDLVGNNRKDGRPPADRDLFEKQVRRSLKFLNYAPMVFVSASIGKNLDKLFKCLELVSAERRKRISTGQINRFLETVDFERASVPHRQKVRIFYITQAYSSPPTFIL